MLFIFYHPPTFQTKHSEDRATRFQLLKELDYVGVVLFSGACLILLLALNWVRVFRSRFPSLLTRILSFRVEVLIPGKALGSFPQLLFLE